MICLIKLFLKGFIIGLGKIIPGVSGALFACIFGVYETIIDFLSNPKLIIKKYNILLPLFLGIFFAIIFGSNVISYLLEYYYKSSMAFFIGMMSYGIIPLIKDKRKVKLSRKEIWGIIIINALIIFLMFVPFNYNPVVSVGIFRDVISLFLCGILDALATIIPGISGTALLMLVGYYEVIITSLSNIYLPVLIPFFIGLFVGIYALAKIINYAFKKHANFMNALILLFTSISILILLIELLTKINIHDVISIIMLFSIGFIISFSIDTKLS